MAICLYFLYRIRGLRIKNQKIGNEFGNKIRMRGNMVKMTKASIEIKNKYLCLFILFLSLNLFAQDNWNEVMNPAPFSTRISPFVFSFKDKLYVANGWQDVGVYRKDIWSTTDGKGWRKEVETVPYPMSASAGLVEFQDKRWILGGRDGC